MEGIDDLAHAFERFPGIGPRQAKRFVYHLLAAGASDRARLARLIDSLGANVRQCVDCKRFAPGSSTSCNYCTDRLRDDSVLMVVEKDQDLAAIERAGTYKGRYFVLGGVLTLSGKGVIRERELLTAIEKRAAQGLAEVVLALSATSEGEHTTDHIRNLLAPLRERIRITLLGRGLSTGSELEYSDAETLRGALQNRKEM